MTRRARSCPFAPQVEGGGAGAGASGNNLPAIVANAVTHADVATIRQWLGDERCVIDASLADGSTALHLAARAGHTNVLRMLLDAGADALVADGETRTALHVVALAGHGLCVKALLDAGADPEGRDASGKTPLGLAEAGACLPVCPPAPPPLLPSTLRRGGRCGGGVVAGTPRRSPLPASQRHARHRTRHAPCDRRVCRPAYGLPSDDAAVAGAARRHG